MNSFNVDDIVDLESDIENITSYLRGELERINKARFETLTDVSGLPYLPNSPAWIREKGNNTPTIGKTGNMRADLAVTDQGDIVRMISNMPYASFVQGKREFLGVSETDLQELINVRF